MCNILFENLLEIIKHFGSTTKTAKDLWVNGTLQTTRLSLRINCSSELIVCQYCIAVTVHTSFCDSLDNYNGHYL